MGLMSLMGLMQATNHSFLLDFSLFIIHYSFFIP